MASPNPGRVPPGELAAAEGYNRAVHEATLDELQRLNDGDFHRLADLLLRHAYPELRALRAYGINKENKPTKGVPDSYVGPDPASCRLAVEHTTTATSDLQRKFLSDIDGVVNRCHHAQRLFLSTNRPHSPAIRKAVLEKASEAGLPVDVVWGDDYAGWLDEGFQDLRFRYLGIQVNSLTRFSAQPAILTRTRQAVEAFGPPRTELQDRIVRRQLDNELRQRKPWTRCGETLVKGAAGMGKTTWSAGLALELAQWNPTIWIPAHHVADQEIDSAVAGAIYGSAEVGRTAQLADILRSLNQFLVVILDGVDEVPDYSVLRASLSRFSAYSVLGRRSHVILTCRTAAAGAFDRSAGRHSDPDLVLPPLRSDQAQQLLRRVGASRTEAEVVETALPPKFAGNPLYLSRALGLLRTGSIPVEDAGWVGAFVDDAILDVAGRLKTGGRGPSTSAVRRALADLALRSLRDPRGADLDEFPDDSLLSSREAGEATVLERACHQGIVVRRESRARICHPLLAEYLAASVLVETHSSSSELLSAAIEVLGGRESVARFVVSLCPELTATLVRGNPTLLTEFDASKLAQPTTEVALTQAQESLRSIYPSVQEAGARILASLGGSTARDAFLAWYRSLSESGKKNHQFLAAWLALSLEAEEEVELAACHGRFCGSVDFAWYDLDFSQRLDRASASFRARLADHAFAGLEELEQDVRTVFTASPSEVRFTSILTFLRDDRILDLLDARVRVGPLSKFQHRALVHFDSDRAMDIYWRSQQQHQRYISGASSAADEERRRSASWLNLFPVGVDVHHFGTDALARLTRRALESEDRHEVMFGMEWASRLQRPHLLPLYADALPDDEGTSTWDHAVEEFVGSLPGEEVRRLFRESTNVRERRLILRAIGGTHTSEVHDLLIGALRDPDLRDAAVGTLARMRWYEGGSAILAILAELDGWSLRRAIDALGRIGYRPAVPDLQELLAHLGVVDREDAQARNLEHVLVSALLLIGGAESVPEVEERLAADPSASTIGILVRSFDEPSRQVLHQLLRREEAVRAVLSHAVRFGYPQWGETLSHRDLFRPLFVDDVVLDVLIVQARRLVQEGDTDTIESFGLYRAIGRFDSPKVDALFGELASTGVSPREVHYFAEWLADRGHRKWMVRLSEEYLDALRGDALSLQVSWRFHSRSWLREEIAREISLRRLQEGAADHEKWLTLLTEVSEPEDDALLRSHLGRVAPQLADAIRSRLRLAHDFQPSTEVES